MPVNIGKVVPQLYVMYQVYILKETSRRKVKPVTDRRDVFIVIERIAWFTSKTISKHAVAHLLKHASNLVKYSIWPVTNCSLNAPQVVS